MEYKWSWERAGRVVKTISDNRMAITVIISNVMLLLVSVGLFTFTNATIEKVSVELVSSALLIVNTIAFLIGKILEARRERKETNTN